MTGKTVSHYRILEKLGAGGMGLVFEAEDLRLGRLVAIKFLSDALAPDGHALQRFEREAKAASALNHPNICTIHEIDEHEGQPFIVMELLQGQPLNTRVRESRIELREALDIAIQVVDALKAAHAEGIIHRDIKPGNVFLTSFGAKVLDFGLAKLICEPRSLAVGVAGADDSSLTADQSLTTPGFAVGTVSYMSPEQARGEPVDERTDIFSFGVMLYEMVTGTLPFRGTSSAATLGAIMYQPQTAPSVLAPGLPRELERVINKTLEKDPDARYLSASDLQTDLARVRAEPDTETKPQLPRKTRWMAVATAASLLLIVAAVALIWWLHSRPSSSATPAAVTFNVPARRSIAVLGFKNLTARPDAAWLSTALSEMLSTELAAGETLRIIPGETVARSKIDLALVDADTFSKETLARIKKNLDTDLVVLGSYIDLGAQAGGQVRLDLRLQDTTQGETIAELSNTGTESNLFQLVTDTGSQLREKLGVKKISSSQDQDVRVSLPASADVTRLYAQGLKQLRVFDAAAARNLLEQVVAAEPDYAQGHSTLSRAYSALGYEEKAVREAKQAFELSTNLSREDRLSIEGRYREASHERERAIEVYRTLWTTFPDNLEYGLHLVDAQVAAGKGRDGITTAQSLRRLPSPLRDDPRIDLAEGAAANSLGDFNQELRLVRIAAGKANDSKLLLARARTREGWDLYRLGKPQESVAALRQAHALFTAAGQRQGAARALQNIANVSFDAGDFQKAQQTHEEALAVYQEIGDRSGVASALNDLANLLYTKGDFNAAKSLYTQSLSVLRELGSKAGVAGALGNLANVMDSQGDLAGAKRMQEQALAAFREVGDQRGASATLGNLGNLLLEMGDPSGARRAMEEALQQENQIAFKSGTGFIFEGLGQVLTAQGDLAGARRNLEQSFAIRRELGQHGNVALTSVDLADLSIHEGKPKVAERLARDAIAQFAKEKALEDQAVALAVLSRALLPQKKVAEARTAIREATALLPASAAHPSRFTVQLTAARVQAATGEALQAKKGLETLLATAERYGFLGYEFEIRLALGEIEMQSGSAQGRSLLESVQKDAASKGFGLISREASAALSRGSS